MEELANELRNKYHNSRHITPNDFDNEAEWNYYTNQILQCFILLLTKPIHEAVRDIMAIEPGWEYKHISNLVEIAANVHNEYHWSNFR